MTKEATATATPRHRPPSRVSGVLLVLGIVLLAANLRPALTGLTPLIVQIRADIVMSYGVAGLLTALRSWRWGCSRRSRRRWPVGLALTRGAGEYARARGGHPSTSAGAAAPCLWAPPSWERDRGRQRALPGLVKRSSPTRRPHDEHVLHPRWPSAPQSRRRELPGCRPSRHRRARVFGLVALPHSWRRGLAPQVRYIRTANTFPAASQSVSAPLRSALAWQVTLFWGCSAGVLRACDVAPEILQEEAG